MGSQMVLTLPTVLRREASCLPGAGTATAATLNAHDKLTHTHHSTDSNLQLVRHGSPDSTLQFLQRRRAVATRLPPDHSSPHPLTRDTKLVYSSGTQLTVLSVPWANQSHSRRVSVTRSGPPDGDDSLPAPAPCTHFPPPAPRLPSPPRTPPKSEGTGAHPQRPPTTGHLLVARIRAINTATGLFIGAVAKATCTHVSAPQT